MENAFLNNPNVKVSKMNKKNLKEKNLTMLVLLLFIVALLFTLTLVKMD